MASGAQQRLEHHTKQAGLIHRATTLRGGQLTGVLGGGDHLALARARGLDALLLGWSPRPQAMSNPPVGAGS